VAVLLGVTSGAIKKWRRENMIPSEKKDELADLIAFCQEAIASNPSLGTIGLWLESPLIVDSKITPADLYLEGLAEDLLAIASDKVKASQVLDKKLPGWRDRFPLDRNHLVVEAPDGQRSIVPGNEERESSKLGPTERGKAYAEISRDQERSQAIRDSALYAARHGLA
jgi:hypothetical protein